MTDIVELFGERRGKEHAAMRGDVSEAAYISALNRFEVALEAPKVTADGSLARVARHEHRRARLLVKRAKKNLSDAELHEIRKAVKRSRYAAELADQAGVSGARRYIKRAKAVQDVLGEHQDAVIAAATLKDIEPDLHRPIARMAASSLRDEQRRHQKASRSDFQKHWRKLETAGPIVALAEQLTGVANTRGTSGPA